MELNFLPKKVGQAIKSIDLNFLYEIRFRIGYPIKVNYKADNLYLSASGISSNRSDAIICYSSDIDYIINYSTEHSIYAYNDRIKEGYITVENGIRIGICGECVYSNDTLQTIKNFTSLNVRLPHEILGCSNKIFNYLLDGKCINNLLIVSPPFLGKTTLLKDLALKLNDLNKYSILIIDERGEFEMISGENIDKIKYCDKNYAFKNAVRSMSPTIIITDELANKSDWECCYNVVASGIKIIASCHSDNVIHLSKKEFFIKDVFTKYVFLSNNGFGNIDSVFDKDFKEI